MKLPEYFADVVRDLNQKSEAIRRDFASHRPSAGGNREQLLQEMLSSYLPSRFGLDTGLISSSSGQFSNQADLIITDSHWNKPFYPSGPNRIWLVEAVYALVEVKSLLSPTEISDSIAKCRKFKTLPRKWSNAKVGKQRDSLFILWAFESPKSETLKENLTRLLSDVPVPEQPDFVIVPNQFVMNCGSYRELAVLGHPKSNLRRQIIQQYGEDLKGFKLDRFPLYELKEHSLFIWWIWLLSWLNRAGDRSPELLEYLPEKFDGTRLL